MTKGDVGREMLRGMWRGSFLHAAHSTWLTPASGWHLLHGEQREEQSPVLKLVWGVNKRAYKDSHTWGVWHLSACDTGSHAASHQHLENSSFYGLPFLKIFFNFYLFIF